jgi:hypothetical protein
MERPPTGESRAQENARVEYEKNLAREAFGLSEDVIGKAREAATLRTNRGEPIDDGFVIMEVAKAASRWREHFLRSHGVSKAVESEVLRDLSGNGARS